MVSFKLLLALAIAAIPWSEAFAASPQIEKLKRDFKCVSYKLTDTKQRGRMTGVVPVWIVVNEGPTNVVVREANRKGQTVGTFDGKNIDLVAGDARYDYTVGLSRDGSAIVHVCQQK